MNSPVIGPATPEDIAGILEVQEANQEESGGTLSARFSAEWFADAIASGWVIVARDDDRIAGYVAFTPREAQAHIPIIQTMLRSGTNPGAYLHGPICVAEDYRGRGLASGLFAAEREHMDHAAVSTFIREDNRASRAAHLRMGMTQATSFEHDGVRYVVLEAAE
ncbi:acetyltransferase (GNAT) family protein [Microterricola gilva]|uniref:Acetyltransferase (GNAT) family protein n=1 Tax=Microterricola gilva TaxID=393267 RepID=A0A4Q8ARD3_9MICO|nr:GNAT family N-acetyltransferase [Microterricola gilva]RZU66791.1 acetyltransferase (GNAT) family protein [Microterricola gilva]